MLFLKLKQPGQLEYNLYFVNNKKLIFHINVYFDDKKKYSLLEKTNKPQIHLTTDYPISLYVHFRGVLAIRHLLRLF